MPSIDFYPKGPRDQRDAAEYYELLSAHTHLHKKKKQADRLVEFYWQFHKKITWLWTKIECAYNTLIKRIDEIERRLITLS